MALAEFALDSVSTASEDDYHSPDFSPCTTPLSWREIPRIDVGCARVCFYLAGSSPGTPEFTPRYPERPLTPERPAVLPATPAPANVVNAYRTPLPATPEPAFHLVQAYWGKPRDVPAVRAAPADAEIKAALPGDVTLMLRNIPNKYSQELLLEHVSEFKRYIDFFYLPIDFKKKCNLGYAFVNFSNGRAADEFVARLHGSRLPSFRKSPKVLAVQRARVQGLEANIQKFRSSAVMGSTSEAFKPQLFRDGKQVEFPKPESVLPPIGARYTRASRAR